jgi:two-component system sensor histidine kinase RegB
MTSTGQGPLWASLRRLAWVRAFAVGGLALALGIAHARGISVLLAPLAGAILFLAAADAQIFLRLRRPRPVTEREVFGQLLVDTAALTWVLYSTGGAANPLAGGYVLLVLYACSVLGSRWVWAFAGICVAGYSAVEFFYVPMPLPPADALDRTRESLASRMIFVLLVASVAWFGVRINELRRQQQSHVSSHAEKEARERYLLGLATLYAGTAHEMSTPLTTIAIVLGDLRHSQTPPPDWRQSIDLLWGQIQICKHSLSELALATNVERLGKVRRLSAKQLIRDVGDHFRLLRPTVQFRLRRVRIDDSLMLEGDDTLSQALFNFLNNAADASPHSVELLAGWKNDRLVIHVLDRGPGVDPHLRERIGRGPITTKPPGRGSGAGVLIAQAVVARFGGTVQIFDRTNGGTRVQIELPTSPSNQEKVHEYREPRVASG